MSISRIFRARNIVAVILVLLLMAVATAFAAANTVNESGAGDGTGTISGYTVDVSYTLDPANPAEIDAVVLDVTPSAGAGPATAAYIDLNASGSWITCAGGGTPFTCTLPAGTTVLSATSIRVVAVE
jgi:hypothetical protein